MISMWLLLLNIQCLFIPQGSNKMIIRNNAITEDDWIVLRLGEQESAEDITVAAGKVIVPLKVWLAQRDALQQRHEIGVWLASDELPTGIPAM